MGPKSCKEGPMSRKRRPTKTKAFRNAFRQLHPAGAGRLRQTGGEF